MSHRVRSLVVSTASVALVAGLLLPAAAAPPTAVPPTGDDPVTDGQLRAEITRTAHGIPHIVADDFTSLGFGQGYAAAEDNICNLADTLVTGRGERSMHFGADGRYTDEVTLSATNRQTDVLFTNIRDRGVVEELLADEDHGPGEETRALVEGYTAGVNHYLDVVGVDDIPDPTCRGGAWVEPGEPIDLWRGIYAANLLASTGVFVPEIVDATPPTLDDPGLPLAAPTAEGFAPVPDVLPTEQELREALGQGEHGFGSNGTALGSETTATGQGMVLGNPHFPWQGRYRFSQFHLTIPGEYDVAGAGLLGAPVVNIGFNEDVAWTHTVSTAFRFTPYEYRAVSVDGLPTAYLTTDGLVRELDRQEVTITVREEDGSLRDVVEDVYRTDEGYVLDAPALLMGWTPISFFALRDANAEHLMTLDVFHEMAKASNVEELLDAHFETGGMPWVNTMAADRHGDALYADASVVPAVPDELVARCATPIGLVLFQLAGLPGLDGTRAQADCAWESDDDAARDGIFGRERLPHTFRDDWVVNANDSYWLPNPDEALEGFARIIGCERCERSLRTRVVYRSVLDRLDGSDGLDHLGEDDVFTHEQLQAIQHENRVFAAELAREGDDLRSVCESADGGEACSVLAAWDGRTNIDSVGAHVFREFWRRTPGDRWNVPFDPNEPVTTPRDLKEDDDGVIDAMRRGLASLENREIDLRAPLGDLQVAGFAGAPPIAIGGGDGGTGNANVVGSSRPAANRDRPYPITFGSSHIQAVAFTEEGPQAATVLTYGIPISETHPEFAGQTELFSEGRWVDFPFDRADIDADAQDRYVVTTGDDLAPAPPGATPPQRPSTPADQHRPEGAGPPTSRPGGSDTAAPAPSAAPQAGTFAASPVGARTAPLSATHPATLLIVGSLAAVALVVARTTRPGRRRRAHG